MRRPTRFLLKGLASLLLGLAIGGIAYERLGRRWDKQRFRQIGRSGPLLSFNIAQIVCDRGRRSAELVGKRQ